jgi:entericidin B
MKKLIAVLGMLAFTVGLSACNTMQGMGKDVERGGEKVQDAASSTQKKM